ncbi:hypothetical protein N657DRAFT_649809 [Parathielavia appendiculata]|uniref:Uncharacterized protein n=1 Tax=Parathielavia appendiculata TaxID=2587402 RepID=A0AAN6TSW1_9PEZI|nr:hypothetical protein N657DRAFT_649809 [Parathielavia appendiculata]
MGEPASEPELLLRALLERWPHLTTVINSGTFPPDTNPGPLIQTITAQDGPNKATFVAMLDCLEKNMSELIAQRDRSQSELSKRVQDVEEYDADLTRATKRISDLDELVTTQRNEVDGVKQALERARAEIAGLNSKITDLNTHQSMENTRVAEYNRRISKLQDEKAELQTRLLQATTTNGASILLEKTSKPRRTTTNPDKFTGGQQDTAKRQSAYERWKTQVEQILVVDAECFPRALDTLTFITSLLSGKAWDAIQDGVQKMNANPKDPELWTWHDATELWRALDRRYILLDSTQSAKNTLDTENRALVGRVKNPYRQSRKR